MASTNQKTIKWLGTHYRQEIYALLIIFGIFPYVYPLSLPLTISRDTLSFYNAINNLKQGSTVLVMYRWGSGNWGELGGCAIALNSQLAQRHLKIVFSSMGTVGPLLLERVIGMQTGGKAALGVYGVDWVDLGFAPGDEKMITAIMESPDGIWRTYGQKDNYGNNFKDLPIMAGVRDHNSIDLVVVLTANGIISHVRQVYIPYKVPILCASIGVDWPEVKTFIDSGMVVGGVASLRGSAEYERLTGFLGPATSAIAGISFNHVLLLGLLIVGNITYWYGKARKETR